jgi:hypothetical protein
VNFLYFFIFLYFSSSKTPKILNYNFPQAYLLHQASSTPSIFMGDGLDTFQPRPDRSVTGPRTTPCGHNNIVMQRKKHAAASPISASNYDNNAKRKTPNRATLTRKCILLVFIASLLVVSSNIYIRFLSITVSDHTAEPIKRVPYKETIASLKQYDDQWWRGMSKDYPHWRGARHPNGTEGMLVDPSPNRLATLDRTKIQCSPTKGAGIEGEGGYKVLQKVKAENPNIVKTGPRILCLVYSVDLPPNGVNDDVANHANLRSIATTWGSKCDGFIGASNSTNHSIGAIDLLHKVSFFGFLYI